MLSLKEWMEITENEIQIDEVQLGRKGWVKTIGIGIQLRINSLSKKVKSSNDTNQKLDRLSDLIRTVSFLSTLNISSDLNDRSLLKGKRS